MCSFLGEAEKRVRDHEVGLASAKAERDRLAVQAEAMAKGLAGMADPDTAPIDAAIRDVEATNQKIRNRDAYTAAELDADAHGRKADELTAEIEGIDAEKASLVSGAKMPIAGLGFDASGGVTFNDIPFEQASQAERLKVSMAIALAQNPKLKVVLIRDGNDLDRANLALVAEMAEAAGATVLIERVEDADGDGWTIEDGMVKSAPGPVEAEAPAPEPEKKTRRRTAAAAK